MTRDEYIAMKAVSQSALKDLLRSPQYYYQKRIAKTIPDQPPSKSQMFGTAVEDHLRLGGRHRFVRLPSDIKARRGKKYLEWRDTLPADSEVLTTREWDEARLSDLNKVAQQVAAHGKAHEVIQGAEWHFRHAWDMCGVECKDEIDIVYRGRLIVEMKTTRDESPAAFARDVDNLGYDLQAAWHRECYRAATGKTLPVAWLVIRNSDPFNVEMYDAERFIAGGMAKLIGALKDLIRRRPDHPEDWWSPTHGKVVTLEPPKWYRYAG